MSTSGTYFSIARIVPLHINFRENYNPLSIDRCTLRCYFTPLMIADDLLHHIWSAGCAKPS